MPRYQEDVLTSPAPVEDYSDEARDTMLVKLHKHVVNAVDKGKKWLIAHEIQEELEISREFFKQHMRSVGLIIQNAGWHPVGLAPNGRSMSRVYMPVAYSIDEAWEVFSVIKGSQKLYRQTTKRAVDDVKGMHSERKLAPDKEYRKLPARLANTPAGLEYKQELEQERIKHQEEQAKERKLYLASLPPDMVIQERKRGRGRPPGSRNKKTLAREAEEGNEWSKENDAKAKAGSTMAAFKRNFVHNKPLIAPETTAAHDELVDETSELHGNIHADIATGEKVTSIVSALAITDETGGVVNGNRPANPISIVSTVSNRGLKESIPAHSGVIHAIHNLRDVVNCISMPRIRKMFVQQINDDAWERLQTVIIDEMGALGWETGIIKGADNQYVLCMKWIADENNETDEDDAAATDEEVDEVVDG